PCQDTPRPAAVPRGRRVDPVRGRVLDVRLRERLSHARSRSRVSARRPPALEGATARGRSAGVPVSPRQWPPHVGGANASHGRRAEAGVLTIHTMLRITLEEGPGTTTVALAGRLAGPWVD